MDLFLYTVLSIIYIMTIHFAVAIKGQFKLFLMIGFFIFGGVLGMALANFEASFIWAIILSLVFW